MSNTYSDVPPDKLALYAKLIATHPAIELKGGTKLPYTSHNGNMFTLLTKEGRVGLRLGQAERDAFMSKFGAQLVEQYGAVLKEYVEVPDALLKKTAALKPWLAQSYAYAQTLKPKLAKKKAK